MRSGLSLELLGEKGAFVKQVLSVPDKRKTKVDDNVSDQTKEASVVVL